MARSPVSVISKPISRTSRARCSRVPIGRRFEVNRYSLKARSPAMPASAEGTGATRLELPSSTGKNLSLWTTFDGYVGDAPLAARLGLDGTALDVVADVPKARPEAIRAVYPAWPIYDEVSAHVEASGELDSLATQAVDHRRPGGASTPEVRCRLARRFTPSSRLKRATSRSARSSRRRPRPTSRPRARWCSRPRGAT